MILEIRSHEPWEPPKKLFPIESGFDFKEIRKASLKNRKRTRKNRR